jgi:hypothetical protein
MVTLKDYQLLHFERILNILARSNVYLDVSRPGRGKTFIAMKLAEELGLPLGVIAPKTVTIKWQEECQRHGIELKFCLSYDSLRSTKGHQPKHGLLHRDDVKKVTRTEASFTPTEKFEKMVEDGILLIFDEAQKIKNDNDQYRACITMARTCLAMGGSTRFGLLSASPFDKEEHVVNMLRMIGYIRHPELVRFNRSTAETIPLGLQELIEMCNREAPFGDPEATTEVLNTQPFDYRTAKTLCFSLYINVLQPLIVSAMPNENQKEDIKNGYYQMTEESGRLLLQGIKDLSAAARYNPLTMMVDRKNINYGAITTALMKIETAKIEIFERLVRQKLEQHPTCKVVVFLNYVDSIKSLQLRLEEYNPLILYGEVEMKNRKPVLDAFQDQSLEHRLLIANTRVGGIGIDLDDKFGDRPRFGFKSENHSAHDDYQAWGRLLRDGSKSIPTCRCVYGDIGTKEMSILNALARKTTVMKMTLQQQVADGAIFPADYPDEIERQIRAE